MKRVHSCFQKSRLFGLIGCSGLALGLALAASSWKPAKAASAGAAAGSGSVSPTNGEYTTSLHIDVPSYYGLEPNVSLSYNSASDDDFVGVGWSLTCASMIERDRKSTR